jgi:hypothetical protein
MAEEMGAGLGENFWTFAEASHNERMTSFHEVETTLWKRHRLFPVCRLFGSRVKHFHTMQLFQALLCLAEPIVKSVCVAWDRTLSLAVIRFLRTASAKVIWTVKLARRLCFPARISRNGCFSNGSGPSFTRMGPAKTGSKMAAMTLATASPHSAALTAEGSNDGDLIVTQISINYYLQWWQWPTKLGLKDTRSRDFGVIARTFISLLTSEL